MKINLYLNRLFLILIWGITLQFLLVNSEVFSKSDSFKENDSLLQKTSNSETGGSKAKYSGIIHSEAKNSETDNSEAFNLNVHSWVDDGVPFLPEREKDVLKNLFLTQREKYSQLDNLNIQNFSKKNEPLFKGIGFIQLKQQSSAYKGQMITIQGRLLKSTFVPFKKNDNSAVFSLKTDSKDSLSSATENSDDSLKGEGFYESWVLLDDEKRIPVRLLTLFIPQNLQTDSRHSPEKQYRQERISATGIYYRQTAFFDGSDFYNAPMIIAESFEIQASPQSKTISDESKANPSYFRLIVLILLILIWLILRFSIFKKRPKIRLTLGNNAPKSSSTSHKVERVKSFPSNRSIWGDNAIRSPRFIPSSLLKLLNVLFSTFALSGSLLKPKSASKIGPNILELSQDSQNEIPKLGNIFLMTLFNRFCLFPFRYSFQTLLQGIFLGTILIWIMSGNILLGISQSDQKELSPKSSENETSVKLESSAQNEENKSLSEKKEIRPEIPGISNIDWDSLQEEILSSPNQNLHEQSNCLQAILQTLFRLNRTIPFSYLKDRLQTSEKNNFAQKGIVPFEGKLIQTQKINLTDEEKERYGFVSIFRCVIRPTDNWTQSFPINAAPNDLNSGNDFIVYVNQIPRFINGLCSAKSNILSEENRGKNEIVSGLGLYFLDILPTPSNISQNESESNKIPLLITNQLNWSSDICLLGQLGINLSFFDNIEIYSPTQFNPSVFLKKTPQDQKRLLNSLRLTPNDRLAFYEMLDISKRLSKGTLIQEMRNLKNQLQDQTKSRQKLPNQPIFEKPEDQILADYFDSNSVPPLELNSTPSPKREERAKFLLASTELFQNPEYCQGLPVYLRGTVKRTSLVLINDSEIKKRFNCDHYYQLVLFADDSQGNPLILSVPELPKGMPVGINDDYREEVEFAGFFYKTWAYQTSQKDFANSLTDVKSDNLSPEEKIDSSKWIRSPLLIGQDLIWHPQENLPIKSKPWLRIDFALSILALLILGILIYRHFSSKQTPIIFRIQGKK